MKKLLLLTAFLFTFSAVHAQNYYPIEDYGLRSGTTRLELYGGMVLPQSDWTHSGATVDLGTTGWTAGLGFYRSLTRVLTLGLDGNYAQFGDGDKAADGSYFRTGAATGLVAGRINFFPRHSTRIYIPAGVGVGHIFARQELSNGSHKTYDSTNLAGMLGLGLEFDIEDIIFGLEGRYYYLRTRNEFKEEFGKSHIHYTEVMLKFGWRF